ncbi:MAG TPA: transglutaminaseTgpA domain-containing protein [Candidatus Dormibacteraeota bacterium]
MAAALKLPASPVEHSGAARAFAWAAIAVAAAAIAYYGQDFVVPPLAVGVAAVGHVISHRRRARSRGFWRQAVIAGLVFACLAYFVLDSVGGLFGGQLPQAHFALLLVAVTSFDLKTRRNLYSSVWISLAVLYLAAVYAWDYPFGLFLAAWMVCLLGFWTASHLRRIEARLSLPAGPVALGGLAVLLGGAFAFWLLPQPSAHPESPLVVSLPNSVHFQGELENPALPLVQFGDSSGANSSVNLRYRGRLGDSVVMYVRTGAPGYWRGQVFDTWNPGSGEWTASRADFKTFPPYADQHRLPPPLGPQLGTFVQVFRVLRTLPDVIYAAQPVQAIYFPAQELRRDAYDTWRAPGPIRAGQTYSIVSSLPDYSPASLKAAEGLDMSLDRDPAGLSAAARRLAAEAVAGAGPTRYEQVMALTTYLQTHYRYSLELGHVPGGRDPVDWFLFDAKVGYCEQFATAETLMLRSLGIPARLATGYATGDYDPVLNQAVVRERDAHAWVEVYFPSRGWVPVDPSPGYSALAATRFPDRFAASGLAHLIPHLTLGAPASVLGSLGLAGVLPGMAAALLLMVAAAAWLLARRRRPRAAGAAGQGELLRLYDRLQRRHGRRRGPPETPLEYLSERGRPDLLAEVTLHVNRGAYRGEWPAPEVVAALAAKLERR